jgi:hypothetical protein
MFLVVFLALAGAGFLAFEVLADFIASPMNFYCF